jgi:hypothetical protein
MLTFLPFLLLLLIVLVVEIISRSRFNIGNQWLILVMSTLFTWCVTLFLRTHLPAHVTISDWLPAESALGSITFLLDANSWNFSFALISLLLGLVLTQTIRLHEQTNIREWSRVILLFSLGVACTLMDSFLAFILIWTIFDILMLLVRVTENNQRTVTFQLSAVFFLHLLGSLLIMAVLIINHPEGGSIEQAVFKTSDFVLLFLGAGLRMTFLGEDDQRLQNNHSSGNLEIVRKMLTPFIVMVFLSRLSQPGAITGVLVPLFIFIVLVSVYASIRWFVVADSENGISYWVTACTGFALISAMRGYPESVVAWGAIMILVGGWVRIFTTRFTRMFYMLVIISLSLLALPLTPSSTAIAGLAAGPLSGFNFILWISVAFLVAGVFRTGMKPATKQKDLESWMKLFYLIGIVILTVSLWIPEIWHLDFTNILQKVLVAVTIIEFLALILILSRVERARKWIRATVPQRIQIGVTRLFGTKVKLKPIYNTGDFIYEISNRLINGFNSILEGEAGILWAFVFLALLISLLIRNPGG